MKLTLKRVTLKKDYTIGQLYVDGVYFCDTLEDTVRNPVWGRFIKVSGKTAIPYGTYTVAVTYSNRFGTLMPEILNVPNFTGIRIHSGNTAEDTDGCVLVGVNSEVGKVTSSKAAYGKLFPLIKDAAKNGKVTIEIV
mgnify:CR=1 FL=1